MGRLACLAQCLPLARRHLENLGVSPSDGQTNVELQYTLQAQQALADDGVELDMHGNIASGAEPRLDIRGAFRAVRGLVGTVSRALMTKERDQFIELGKSDGAATSQQRDAVRLQSCASGAGEWVEAIPSRPAVQLNDAEFNTGTRFRMGLP